ncbi:MAG: hypothetical protein CMO80_03795 [Verrucomicrobiales bacterium]|nr:hypothetical protein [Verrucomicrobiales bacterium]
MNGGFRFVRVFVKTVRVLWIVGSGLAQFAFVIWPRGRGRDPLACAKWSQGLSRRMLRALDVSIEVRGNP